MAQWPRRLMTFQNKTLPKNSLVTEMLQTIDLQAFGIIIFTIYSAHFCEDSISLLHEIWTICDSEVSTPHTNMHSVYWDVHFCSFLKYCINAHVHEHVSLQVCANKLYF